MEEFADVLGLKKSPYKLDQLTGLCCILHSTCERSDEMHVKLTVADRLLSALKTGVAPICDDCLTLELGLTVRQHANSVANFLSGLGKIKRELETCRKCGKEKLTNQAVKKTSP